MTRTEVRRSTSSVRPGPYGARVLSVDFQDASVDAPADVHLPTVVQAFEGMGHVRFGRLRRVVSPGGRERVARG